MTIIWQYIVRLYWFTFLFFVFVCLFVLCVCFFLCLFVCLFLFFVLFCFLFCFVFCLFVSFLLRITDWNDHYTKPIGLHYHNSEQGCEPRLGSVRIEWLHCKNCVYGLNIFLHTFCLHCVIMFKCEMFGEWMALVSN